MKYAIVRIASKQYRVSVGDVLTVEKIPEIKKTITFDEVLLLVDNDKVAVGTPTIKNATVKASLIEEFRDKKIRVASFRAKSRSRKVKGHRQHQTRLKIDSISTK